MEHEAVHEQIIREKKHHHLKPKSVNRAPRPGKHMKHVLEQDLKLKQEWEAKLA